MNYKHFLNILESDIQSLKPEKKALKTLHDTETIEFLRKMSEDESLGFSELQII